MLYGEDNLDKDMMDKVVSGPLISGCTMDTENGHIIIEFDEKFLNGEKVQIMRLYSIYHHLWKIIIMVLQEYDKCVF